MVDTPEEAKQLGFKVIDDVPVIDLEGITGPNVTEESTKEVFAQIEGALRHLAFFQVINHGLSKDLIDRTIRVMQHFFSLPVEKKTAVNRTPTNAKGYLGLMTELTKRRPDWKEAFDFAGLDCDTPSEERGLDGHNQWPEGETEFKDTLIEYFNALETLSVRLLEAVSVSLGLEKEYLRQNYLQKSSSFIRLNHYPPCPEEQLSSVLGVGPHSDAGILTLLLQDEVGGLQVLNRQEQWVDIKPIPYAFVVNIGDMLQIWSNDQFPATQHRVVVNSAKERFSIPFFFNPTFDADISPLPITVDETHPPKYGTINYGKFMNERHAGNQFDLGEEVQIHHFKTGGGY